MAIYRSKTGGTEKIAKRIAKDFESPLLKVGADVLYDGFFSAYARVVTDRLQENLPKSIIETPDVSGCGTLFLGFPIWWDDMPDYYKEFLGRLGVDGKCLIPSATSGRSDMSHTVESLRTLSPNAEIRNPFHFGITQRGDCALWKWELSEDVAIEDVIR